MHREEIIENILKHKIIAIVRGIEPEKCIKVAEAILRAGINMIEVTFDQTSRNGFQETRSAIHAIRERLDDQMYVGAGTVLTIEQVDLAIEAGAEYIITPAVDVNVIRYVKEKNMVVLPGALTPTEAVRAYTAGADMVKIFPAADLGPGYLKSLKAPLKHIPMLAVGGVTEKNIGDYLAAGALGVGVGCLANKTWIANGEYDRITACAEEMVRNAQ